MGLGNDFFFEIRRRLPALRRTPYCEELPRSQWGLLGEGRLGLKQASALSKDSLIQNLIYGEILERIQMSFDLEDPLRVLDVGSRHFVYAPALTRWLESRARGASIELCGLEVDPYQLYFDLYRRGDLGRYYAKVAEGPRSKVDYLEGDWLKYRVEKRLDLITCFFPYLFDDLHRKDRLPGTTFDPHRFYEKIFSSSKRAVFFHQGEAENEASLEIIHGFSKVSILEQFSVKETAYGGRKHPLYVISLTV